MQKQLSTATSMLSRRHSVRALATLALAVASVTALGCAKESTALPSSASQASAGSADLPAVLATVDGKPIAIADLASVSENLRQLEEQYLQNRSKFVEAGLDSVIAARMLATEATKQGKPVETLLSTEAGGTLEASESEIQAWYQENQPRLNGRSIGEVRSQIADFLKIRKRKDAASALQNRLMAEQKVTINFQPFRLALDNQGAPTLGKSGAPVTVVEFSDFQCPFCKRFAPSLKQIVDKYGDKVQVIYRQYPIPSLHPNAFKAAEASLCANEQGKFWELHDLMFAEQQNLTVSELKQKAGRLGMNQEKFNSCLDTGRYVERVENDVKEGNRIGVGNSGTPAVYINGAYLEGGAVPFETLARIIDKELARSPKGN